MKKAILILCAAFIILAITAYFLVGQSHRKVEDFGVFPCDLSQATAIDIEDQSRHVSLKQEGGHWFMVKPVSEAIDSGADQALNHILRTKLFVDDKREISEKTRAEMDKRLQLTFKREDRELCKFSLGEGIKTPNSDSEHRWVTYNNLEYRTFIPLIDYALIFEQPTAGWRDRKWLDLTTSSSNALEYRTGADSFRLERNPKLKTEDNPQGWEMKSAKLPEGDVNLSTFLLDEDRVATVIELITPLTVDDWADSLTAEEKENLKFGGTLTIEAREGRHVLYIGSEIDQSSHPEWSWLGEGARYLRMDEDPRVGIISRHRVMGIFPSFDDMRSKSVWTLDSTHFSGIEVNVGDQCLRYGANAQGIWSALTCQHGGEAVDETPLKPTALGNYIKTLTLLQAIRYAIAQELQPMPVWEAEVRIYEDNREQPHYRLRISTPRESRYRYAQIVTETPAGEKDEGPIFVITEGIVRLLLEDLRHAQM